MAGTIKPVEVSIMKRFDKNFTEEANRLILDLGWPTAAVAKTEEQSSAK